MKRNAFLMTAVLFCLATTAVAADQKKDAQPQSKQTEQTQVARNDTSGPMGHASVTKDDCTQKPARQPKVSNMHDDPEGDPQASQNQVEYGGGG